MNTPTSYQPAQAMIALQSAHIETALRLLKHSDPFQRAAAFAAIERVPRAYLERAWENARQLRPVSGGELDCLERVEVLCPNPIVCERAIVTVVTPGFEPLLETLLESLEARAGLDKERLIVFAVDDSFAEVSPWTQRFPHLQVIPCRGRERYSTAIKGVLYSCARWVHANSIVAVECDMLCLGSFAGLWTTLENVGGEAFAGVRPCVADYRETVADVLHRMGAGPSHFSLVDMDDTQIPFRWNGGLLAGTRAAWLEIDRRLRSLAPLSLIFVEGAFPLWFGDEALVNAVASQLESPFDLAPRWNVQVGSPQREHSLHVIRTPTGMNYRINQWDRVGEHATMLHFLAGGRPHLALTSAEIKAHGLGEEHK